MTVKVNTLGINELDFPSGVSSVSVSDGVATINLSAGSSITLQTNGVNNGSQTKLNLTNGTDIAITDDGVGDVTVGVSGKDAANGLAGLDGSTLLKTAEFPALTGDVTSTVGTVSTTVGKLQGRSVSATAPSGNQVLAWNATNVDWEPTSIASIPNANASELQSVNISTNTPFDQDVLRYVKANTDWEPSFQLTFYYEWMTTSDASSPTTGVRGMFGTVSEGGSGGATLQAPSVANTLPAGWQLGSSASASTEGGISLGTVSSTVGTPFQLFRRMVFKVKLNQTTNMRIWLGMGQGQNAGLATGWSSDTPAANFVGFRYSTHASDAKYQCVTQTSAANQTVTPESTASHVDTSAHTFELRWDDTNAIFLIDGTQVGSQNTNMPLTTTGLFPFVQIDNVATANTAAFIVYYMGGIAKKVL